MGGGAAQLLQHNVFIKEEAIHVVRRGRKPETGPRHFSVRSAGISCLVPAACSTIRLRSLRHLDITAHPTGERCSFVVGRERRGDRNVRQCSESRITDSPPEANPTASNDSAGVSPEVYGEAYVPNASVVLSPERELDDFTDDDVVRSNLLVEKNVDDGSKTPAVVESVDTNSLSSAQEQNGTPGVMKDDLQSQQSETIPFGAQGEEVKSVLDQTREIFVFAGPALGIWLSGPLMSIIDTAVIGNSSSLELAALGPGTVLCDQTCFVFMFLSIATSNLIATSLAQKNEEEAAGHLSRLLFVALFCGMGMLLITEFFATPLLQAFVGVKNYSLIPASRLYVQIRALAWPVVLMGMVAQSASLGMQDSMAPLKVLALSSSVNLVGDVVLCTFLGYGIGGAAWATMASQYVGTFFMLESLRAKGYNPLAISVPSVTELITMVKLAGPILLTMLSKASFYTIITFLATSLGATTLGAHQVMIGIFSLCTVCGEPLAQTAQSFMPALIYGSRRNLKQARSLLQNLLRLGLFIGLTLGSVGVTIPWILPQLFTRDAAVIKQMRSLCLPFFLSLAMTPPTLCCEGTLLAGRDLLFLGFNMASCFLGGSVLLVGVSSWGGEFLYALVTLSLSVTVFVTKLYRVTVTTLHRLGVGLPGSWWTLVAFQTARFIQSYTRLAGSKSILAEQPSYVREEEKAKIQPA